MVRSFQISAVFPHLSLLENVRIALQRPLGTSFHFWKSESSLESLNDRSEELLSAVALFDYRHLTPLYFPYVRTLSLVISTSLPLSPSFFLLFFPVLLFFFFFLFFSFLFFFFFFLF